MHQHGRVDSNHDGIVDALRQMGASVTSLADLGGGVPDLLVGLGGETELVEVKGGKGKLTDDQVEWHATWRGRPVRVLRSVEQALSLAEEMRRGFVLRKTTNSR
jgi:hypothetical protein